MNAVAATGEAKWSAARHGIEARQGIGAAMRRSGMSGRPVAAAVRGWFGGGGHGGRRHRIDNHDSRVSGEIF
jgi:hypothetical protein